MAIIAKLRDTTSKVVAGAIAAAAAAAMAIGMAIAAATAAVTATAAAIGMAIVAAGTSAVTAAATAAAMAIAFLKSPLCPQLVTSALAFPGLLYVLDAYNVLPVVKPILKGMKVEQKFEVIGVKYQSPTCNAMMAAIGASKISISVNHFVLKGGLDLLYAVVSTLGFLLVIYAHRAIKEPLTEDIFVVVLIVAFWRIYYLGKSKVD